MSVEMESVLSGFGVEDALNDFLLPRKAHLGRRVWSIEVVLEPLRHPDRRLHQRGEVRDVLCAVHVLQWKRLDQQLEQIYGVFCCLFFEKRKEEQRFCMRKGVVVRDY